jgi:phage-related protein (TIGR01555 family)
MLGRFFHWLFRGPTVAPQAAPLTKPPGYFSTDDGLVSDGGTLGTKAPRSYSLATVAAQVFGANLAKLNAVRVLGEDLQTEGTVGALAMDDAGGSGYNSIKAAFALGHTTMPEAQAMWYGSQGFIGYQMCAIIAQQWLVDKACTVPARDAIRKGYTLKLSKDFGKGQVLIDALQKADKRFKVKKNLVQFLKMGRVFGVRVAMCKVKSTDPQYYQKPFNPDGITAGTYEGICQIDPYWVVPELTTQAAMDPASIHFYEPTFWIVNGERVHRSHLIVMRGSEVADILKPSYLFGGMSIPQLIYERVYAAERSANEAPQLMMTKRSTIFYTDIEKFMANQAKSQERMEQWRTWLDNYGVKLASSGGDKVEQHDTALTDLDVNIMAQYQLVAAVANVPATKLLGTSPRGFGAAGDYEIENYHEMLETLQTDDAQPLLERHHICVIRSEIAPRHTNGEPFDVDVTWNTLDTPTAKEQAEINEIEARTDAALVTAGIVSADEARDRIANDPSSGYEGIPVLEDEDELGAAL